MKPTDARTKLRKLADVLAPSNPTLEGLMAGSVLELLDEIELYKDQILYPIAKEVIERAGRDVGDGSYNPDAHIHITLTAAECRRVLEAVGLFKPATPDMEKQP